METPSNSSLASSSEMTPVVDNWQTKTLVLGGVLGAAVGLLSALLLVKNAERNGIRPTVGSREGFQMAVLAFGLIRSIANLWEE